MIEKLTLKSGLQSILINGIRYHSSYDPEREAQRFITNTIGNGSPSTVIICGAGIGYLADAVKKQFPSAKIILLFYKKELFDLSTHKGKIFWHPDLNKDIDTFLHESLSELDIEGLQTIEWPAGASLFPEISKQVHSSLSQIIKEKRGTIVTSIAMGRLWIKNSFYNFIHINDIYTGNPFPHNNPVVLAASGPSLEKSIHLLKKWRNKVYIIALPSAVTCLLSHDIKPDIIVMTDPGYYSMHHLQWAQFSSTAIFMPLSGATGIGKTGLKVVYFSQPNFFEKLLLEKTNFPYPSFPPKGTVAATALEIALFFSMSEIIIAGLDLCFTDIVSHARPHPFDTLFTITDHRCSPFYSRKFERAHHFAPEYNHHNKTRTSLALKTYQGWFQSLPPHQTRRLIRLNPSPVEMKGTLVMEEKEINTLLSHKPELVHSGPLQKIDNYPEKEIRLTIVKELIESWNNEIDDTINIIKDTRGFNVFNENTSLLQLLYFLNLKQMTTIKRKIRLKGEAMGIEPTLAMLNDSRLFLEGCYNKITDVNMSKRTSSCN
ncbi:MAG: DUF115 domain-containing protein [Spirochaetales bacterium]|nr:DUF115 domain-containing protein [Spirochaetales bacterium]